MRKVHFWTATRALPTVTSAVAWVRRVRDKRVELPGSPYRGRAVEVCFQQAEHVEFAFAQRIDEALGYGGGARGLAAGCEKLANVVGAMACRAAPFRRATMGGPSSTKSLT
jgi:hypothetical protein